MGSLASVEHLNDDLGGSPCPPNQSWPPHVIDKDVAALSPRIITRPLKAPFAKDQVPYFYRFAHGWMQATVIWDGILPLGEPPGTSSARPRTECRGPGHRGRAQQGLAARDGNRCHSVSDCSLRVARTRGL